MEKATNRGTYNKVQFVILLIVRNELKSDEHGYMFFNFEIEARKCSEI